MQKKSQDSKRALNSLERWNALKSIQKRCLSVTCTKTIKSTKPMQKQFNSQIKRRHYSWQHSIYGNVMSSDTAYHRANTLKCKLLYIISTWYYLEWYKDDENTANAIKFLSRLINEFAPEHQIFGILLLSAKSTGKQHIHRAKKYFEKDDVLVVAGHKGLKSVIDWILWLVCVAKNENI